jgi:hypothetical protein
MRSFLLIFATLLLVGGAFAAYLWWQPEAAKRPTKANVSAVRTSRGTPTTTQQSLHGIGGGENPWVKRFENGELTSQFRSLRWTPKGGEVVEVTKPEAQFFSGDGTQMLVVEGVSGEVIVPGGAAAAQSGGSGPQQQGFSPPSRGQLRDVKISMFQPADAATPTLVATMPNAAFDNDTFRISTEAYTDETGKRVEADQVPVRVDGQDYDFRGRGLVIRWNQRDRRLQLLEVAHGESLTVKNVDALSKPPQARLQTREMLASNDPFDAVLLAAATTPKHAAAPKKPAPRKAPVTTTAATTRAVAPTVYRATFEDAVKVFEADKQVASADRLEIDLLQKESDEHAASSSSSSTTQPATRSSRRGRRADDSTRPATSPAVQGPVTVKWTGKLRVVPLEEPPDPSLVAGKAIVRMTGAPVDVAHTDMKARCGVLAFNTADGSASLRANEIVPIVELTTDDGSKVTTPSVTYATAGDKTRVATLVGKSTATLTSKGQKDPLTLNWSRDGVLYFVDLEGGTSAMERADFSGDVHIVHPSLDMTSQSLGLRFDPTALAKADAAKQVDPSDSLREIVAGGGVNARISEAGAEDRRIASQDLRVELNRSPAGETYARLIQAKGGVRTNQGKDTLEAGQFTAELAPAATQPTNATVDASDTKPAKPQQPFGGGNTRLVSLVASEQVKLSTQDGSNAAADVLRVEEKDGHPIYVLEGKPVATVTQDKTVITGPTIRFAPGAQVADIAGAGTMTGTLPDDPKETFDVAWAGGASVSGAQNLIDVTRGVTIKSKQSDGTINTATSDRLQATLEPTTKPVATAPAKSKQAGEMEFLKGKEVTRTTLFADAGKRVEVKSELFGPDGALLRGMNLYAPVITTNRATGRLDIPVAGEMLYQDHRPPEQAGDEAKDGPTIGSGRGQTAFGWTKSLAYDDGSKTVTLTGDAHVVHHPDPATLAAGGAPAKDAQPFELWSDVLTAQLERDPTAPAAETPPQGQIGARMRLKLVTADGHVRVESARLNVDGSRLTYDPVAGVLRAFGSDGAPLTVVDKERGTSSTAAELEWNTKTDQFRVTGLSGKVRP